MANFEIEFFSDALRGIQRFHAIVPSDMPKEMTAGNPNFDRPTKLMILLHGYNGTHTDWLYGTNINTLSGVYNIAFITPDGKNSFYLNDDAGFYRYQDYVGEELVNFARKTFKLSDKREDTLIGGFSMGGFGAIHTAFTYTETFGSLFAMSNALIVDKVSKMKPIETDFIANYDIYTRIFGDLSKLKGSNKDPKHLIETAKKEGKNIPKIFLSCGTEDFLIEENRDFKKFLDNEGVEAKYVEAPGIHDWSFWQSQLEPALKYILDINDGPEGKDYFVKGE